MTGCGSLPGIPYPENSTTERSTERKVLKNAINYTKRSPELKNRDLIGFVGAPWTLLILSLIHI